MTESTREIRQVKLKPTRHSSLCFMGFLGSRLPETLLADFTRARRANALDAISRGRQWLWSGRAASRNHSEDAKSRGFGQKKLSRIRGGQ
jgi:hypothetical protein